MPKNEDASEFELQNEANTGTMRGIDSGGVIDESTRLRQDAINFHRGMFALMASYDWDRGKFSEHPQDVDLRNEAFELLNLPPHLSPQFNKAKAEELLQSLGNIREKDKSGQIPEETRSGDYVRNLIKLSQTRFGTKKPK